MINVSVLNNML